MNPTDLRSGLVGQVNDDDNDAEQIADNIWRDSTYPVIFRRPTRDRP